MSYIDRLNDITSRKHPQGSLTQPTQPAERGQVSVVSVRSVTTFPNAREAFSAWRAHLARLDPCQPPEGWTMNRWQQMYDDADWLLGNFGEQAARDGWSSADLFGLWVGVPHAGGIANRLRGSRSLVLTADRAHWRSWGQVERFNRGSYPDLRPFWGAA